MTERGLNTLVENELYRYIIAISGDSIKNVNISSIESGLLYFFMEYDLTRKQRKQVIDKIWSMFKNKNKELEDSKRYKYDEKISEIEDIEL